MSFVRKKRAFRPSGQDDDDCASASKKPKIVELPSSDEEEAFDLEESISGLKWSSEQKIAIECALSGKNVFITGPGGVGKSEIIPEIVSLLQIRKHKVVALTASTGVAAVKLGGTTLHSFAGFGLGDKPVDICIRMARYSKTSQLKFVDTLFVDEISMIQPEYFEKLDEVARAVRNKPDKPFGGMQLIVSGDFLQLPPVSQRSGNRTLPGLVDTNRTEFVFETKAWKSLDLVPVKLETIFRQTDKAFCEALGRARYGELTHDDAVLFSNRVNAQLAVPDGIEPTHLFSRNADVDALNYQRLLQCKGPDKVYKSTLEYSPKSEFETSDYARKLWEAISKNPPAETELKLRVGAQVMLLVNLDVEAGLANGSRGVVIGFEEQDDIATLDDQEAAAAGYTIAKKTPAPIVKFVNGEVITVNPKAWKRGEEDKGIWTFKQVPLRLAWGVSIHKSQGCTLDCGVTTIDSGIFEFGQAYVALSRFRSLESMRLTAFDASAIRAHPKVVQFYKRNCHVQ